MGIVGGQFKEDWVRDEVPSARHSDIAGLGEAGVLKGQDAKAFIRI